jgi:rhodanese-related sulfurtransferase
MADAGNRGTPEIDVDEFDRRFSAGEVNVLDVREEWEFRRARVPGVLHVPLGQLPSRIGELPKDKPLMIICEHGNRSLVATHFLLVKGFPGTASVEGGTVAWIRSGRTIERDQAW